MGGRPAVDTAPGWRPAATSAGADSDEELLQDACGRVVQPTQVAHGVLAHQRVVCSMSLHALQEEGMRPQCLTDEERRKQTKEHV